MSEKKLQYVDFGAPDTFGAHLFYAEIPSTRTGDVTIIEDYGYRGQEGGIPKDEERVFLKRNVWSEVSEIAKKEFNDRLRAAKLPIGRWHAGKNQLDRLLGKELCVLAWAAETANENELPIICSKWAALRPEERWWLFSMTVAESGLAEDTGKGWRKALFYALSDGDKKPVARKRRRPAESDIYVLPLFSEHK